MLGLRRKGHPEGKDGKLSLLEGVETLRACLPRELDQIARLGDESAVEAGTVLVGEGDRPWWTYLVLDGAVGASRGGQPLGVVGPGGFCGDVPVVSRRPSAQTLTALTRTRVLAFGRREFLGALDEIPGLADAVLRSLAAQANHAQVAEAPPSAGVEPRPEGSAAIVRSTPPRRGACSPSRSTGVARPASLRHPLTVAR